VKRKGRRNGLILNTERQVWSSHVMTTEKGKNRKVELKRKWGRESANCSVKMFSKRKYKH
jgi:hypothetical protein